jgi:hypothetical protein
MFAVSILIIQSGLFERIKPSLNSFRNGNLALKAARSLSVMADVVSAPGSRVSDGLLVEKMARFSDRGCEVYWVEGGRDAFDGQPW